MKISAETRLEPIDGGTVRMNFGAGVAMDDAGERAWVGAPRWNQAEGVFDRGAVFAFSKETGWAQEYLMQGPDQSGPVMFGARVSFHRGWLAVTEEFGFGGDVFGVGAVNIYSVKSDNELPVLVSRLSNPHGGKDSDGFGRALSWIGGDDEHMIAIGSAWEDSGSTYAAGAVHVFEWNSAENEWKDKATLSTPQPQRAALCGVSVSGQDNIVVMGCPGYADVGRVQVFVDFVAVSFIEGKADNAFFGRAVALSPVTGELLIGAPYDHRFDGRVYSYSIDDPVNPELLQELDAPVEGGHFGWSLSVRPDVGEVAIGAPNTSTDELDYVGAVTLYSAEYWIMDVLYESDPSRGSQWGENFLFGESGRLIVGSPSRHLADGGATVDVV